MSSYQISAPTVQGVLHIHRTETLHALIDLAAFNPSVGHSVKDLTIALPGDSGDAVQAIRRALRMTPNVEKLVLTVGGHLPAYILGGITFHGLKSFSTNLPHIALPSFLHRHPFITSLALRGVDCNTCPIRAVPFLHLIALQCSSRCFRTGIAHGRFVPPSDRLALVPISNQPTRTVPTLRVEILALDFYPNEHDVLANVAATAPNVRTLKLNERPHPQQHAHGSRRAWRDVPEWHRALMRMPFLEELCLCTFARVGSPRRSDSSVICGWAGGGAHRAISHMSLFRVALIQPDAESGQRLSHWYKKGRGEWECITSTAVGPHQYFCI